MDEKTWMNERKGGVLLLGSLQSRLEKMVSLLLQQESLPCLSGFFFSVCE